MQNDPNLVEFYFEVVDTGIGIPKEKRMSVFENYVQVNKWPRRHRLGAWNRAILCRLLLKYTIYIYGSPVHLFYKILVLIG